MGSYPYPSSYILNGDGLLPPYPMREMCKRIKASLQEQQRQQQRPRQHQRGYPVDPKVQAPTDEQLATALAAGVGVFYNYTGKHPAPACYDLHGSANNATTRDSDFWDYLYCSEMMQPMSRDGVHDMFWAQVCSFGIQLRFCPVPRHLY